jgi:hypothetical protein
MTMIYAVFICGVLNGQFTSCQPTVFNADLTAQACEMHRQYVERLVKPGAKVICMKKEVPIRKRRLSTGRTVAVE